MDMRKLSLYCAVSLLAVSSMGQPRPPDNVQTPVTIVDGITVSVPAAWQVAYRTKWVTELRVPRQKDRRPFDPIDKRDLKERAKPPLDEARMLIGYETRRSHAEAL